METSTELPPVWDGPLAPELKTFYAHKSELLKTAKGKYALIKGNDLIGIFDREDEALNEGYHRFRLERFMVQRVQKDFESYYIGGSAVDTEE